MKHDPQTIFFQTELEFLPLEEQRLGEKFIYEIFQRLSRPVGQGLFRNLSAQDHPPTMTALTVSADGGSTDLRCQIRPHSILVEERKTNKTAEEFGEVLVQILKAAQAAAKGIGQPCPPVFVQRCRIQCLDETSHKEPLELLSGRVANVFDAVGPFKRLVSHFGVRFQFPPYDRNERESAETGPDDKDGEEEEAEDELVEIEGAREDWLTLRLETYPKRPECVWMEVASVKGLKDPVEISSTDVFKKNIEESYAFLGRAIDFLDQFDKPSSDGDVEDKDEPENPEKP